MKLVIVQYDDTVDTSILPKGTVVSVSDGTNTLSNGKVYGIMDAMNPEPTVSPSHIHPLPAGETGPVA